MAFYNGVIEWVKCAQFPITRACTYLWHSRDPIYEAKSTATSLIRVETVALDPEEIVVDANDSLVGL